jgi:7-cyano-7-deazaguanine reductase
MVRTILSAALTGAGMLLIAGCPVPSTLGLPCEVHAHCDPGQSLKLYLWSYRDEGAFHEAVTNKILDDLVAATSPRSMTVEGDFWVRGGIGTVVVAKHEQGEA